MPRIQSPLNQAYTIVTNNAGTLSSFTFDINGVFTATKIAVKVGGFNGFFTHANTADRIYTAPDRAGTLALQDATALIAMLPALVSGQVLTNNGSALSWMAVPNLSLATLNGINTNTYNAQTFAIGTTGTAPTWVSIANNTNTHTLNIPMASAASVTAGLLSNADYANIPFKNVGNTFANTQVFTNAPTITNTSTNANSAATYGQVLAMKASLAARVPVDFLDTVTTAASLAGITTVDGTAPTVGIRVLATALTGGNGGKVYKCASTGPSTWTLETDGQNGDGTPADGDILFVKGGTAYHDQQWAYNGTTWVLYNVSQSWTFSTGLSVTGTTVTVAYGATGTTACVGNDARLSDSRTPTAHVLDSATHTITGKTAGQVLLATGATTYAFTSFSGDVGVAGTGATLVNNIQGVAVASLGLTVLIATLADNTGAATLVTGCSFAVGTLRNVKIDFSLARGAGNYACGYLNILHDGTNAYLTQVYDVELGTLGVTFTVDISGGNLRLLYTTTSTGVAVTMKFNTTLFPQ